MRALYEDVDRPDHPNNSPPGWIDGLAQRLPERFASGTNVQRELVSSGKARGNGCCH